jgi:general secretion pathway protein G
MSRSIKKLLVGISVVVLLALVIPNFIRARKSTATNACVNNLRQIEAAKWQWAIENKKTTNDIPTWNDVRPYTGHGAEGEILHCPAGGQYVIGRVGDPPKCSIGGEDHTLK